MSDPNDASGLNWQGVVILALLTGLGADAASLTWHLTATAIERNDLAPVLHKAEEALAAQGQENDLYRNALVMPADPQLSMSQPFRVYRAVHAGAVTAVVLPVIAPNGYRGPIELLVGIRADGRLSGVTVLSDEETPGIGDRIEREKSPWILQFNGHSLTDPPEAAWHLRQDGGAFDGMSGATITPRAVVNAVHGALQYFEYHKDQLLAPHPAQAGLTHD